MTDPTRPGLNGVSSRGIRWWKGPPRTDWENSSKRDGILKRTEEKRQKVRIPWPEARVAAEALTHVLMAHRMSGKWCGSLRRKASTVGDLDLAIAPPPWEPSSAPAYQRQRG